MSRIGKLTSTSLLQSATTLLALLRTSSSLLPELLSTLVNLPQQLWVFTNADINHAKRVLSTLKVEDCFNGIVDLFALEFQVKPKPASYQIAMKLAGEDDPSRCMMFDDLLHNLLPAKQMGFTTVLVGKDGSPDGIDYCLDTIHQIREMIPQLWKDMNKENNDQNR